MPAKTRAEINRQNYERSKIKRQEKARDRIRAIREGWRTALADWDRSHEWTEAPSDWPATGLGQWSVESALANPADSLDESETH
jgi:hypothetical protein